MFRIIFLEDGLFHVQILRYLFIWRTVKTFPTLNTARMHVDNIGLSKHYKEQTPMREWLMGGTK
jgi:hypothetical protein